jgi:hypothetical protein
LATERSLAGTALLGHARHQTLSADQTDDSRLFWDTE